MKYMFKKHLLSTFLECEQAAAKYIENKRPIFPVKYNKSDYVHGETVLYDPDIVLEHIDLCSSVSESENNDHAGPSSHNSSGMVI